MARWRVAVTSFCHLPVVERHLNGRGVPVIALLAEAHLETLHSLAQLPPDTRVGIASTEPETAHNLEHSIANASLPNIVLVGACPTAGPTLARLVRRVDVMVCSTSAADQVRALAGPRVQVITDDRALDQRALEMLATVLVRQNSTRGASGRAAAGATRRPPSTRSAANPMNRSSVKERES